MEDGVEITVCKEVLVETSSRLPAGATASLTQHGVESASGNLKTRFS